jgi:putative YhbY family RNA-binding protein
MKTQQRRWLKQQAHHLKPVVLLGQHGLSEAVLAEIQLALDHHELIKIRVNGVAIYFRANPKHKDPMVLPG